MTMAPLVTTRGLVLGRVTCCRIGAFGAPGHPTSGTLVGNAARMRSPWAADIPVTFAERTAVTTSPLREGPVREEVVLVDEEGRPTGVADKATVHGPRTPRHLAFSCYGFDAAGRVLVTRRAAGKRTFPLVWTGTCCGHPAPGEAVDAARAAAGCATSSACAPTT